MEKLRFRKRPVVVEAQPYEKGIEDGIQAVPIGEMTCEVLEIAQVWHGDAVKVAIDQLADADKRCADQDPPAAPQVTAAAQAPAQQASGSSRRSGRAAARAATASAPESNAAASSPEGGAEAQEPAFELPFIKTIEGNHFIRPTDFIITGVAGARYPVKKEIFEATYEPAPDGITPAEIDEADRRLSKLVQDYLALGRFIPAVRSTLGGLSERWEKGERTLAIHTEIMAAQVPER